MKRGTQPPVVGLQEGRLRMRKILSIIGYRIRLTAGRLLAINGTSLLATFNPPRFSRFIRFARNGLKAI